MDNLKDKLTNEAEKQPSCLGAVMRRFLMEFMLNNKVEREEVECEDWSKAKHFIQRKYKLQDEPRVVREVKTYAQQVDIRYVESFLKAHAPLSHNRIEKAIEGIEKEVLEEENIKLKEEIKKLKLKLKM